MAALSSDPAQMMGMSSSHSSQEPNQDAQVEVVEDKSQTTQVNTPEQNACESIETTYIEMSEVPAESTLPRPASLKRRSSAISLNEGSSFTGQDHFVKSFNSTPGYLSNRWNNMNSSFSSPAATQKPSFTTPNTSVFPKLSQHVLSWFQLQFSIYKTNVMRRKTRAYNLLSKCEIINVSWR